MKKKFNIYQQGKFFPATRNVRRELETILTNAYGGSKSHTNGEKNFFVRNTTVILNTNNFLKKPLTIIGDKAQITKAIEGLQESCKNYYIYGSPSYSEIYIGKRSLF